MKNNFLHHRCQAASILQGKDEELYGDEENDADEIVPDA
jgi:hypothetical protein